MAYKLHKDLVCRKGGIAIFSNTVRGVNVQHVLSCRKVLKQLVETIQERRKYARLNLELPINISAVDETGHRLEESSVTVNVSARGAYFASQTTFQAPMELAVSITVPYSVWGKLPFPRLEAPAKVVRVESPPNAVLGDKEMWGVAVCFQEALSATFEPTKGT